MSMFASKVKDKIPDIINIADASSIEEKFEDELDKNTVNLINDVSPAPENREPKNGRAGEQQKVYLLPHLMYIYISIYVSPSVTFIPKEGVNLQICTCIYKYW